MYMVDTQLWFDPICPWAWITSRWILEVEKVRDINVTWNIFSLAHLNRDNEMTEQYVERTQNSWSCGRVIMAAQSELGPQVILPLYTAIGTRIHLAQEKVSREMLEAALEEAGLTKKYAVHMNAPSWDPMIIESHDKGIALVGNDVGTPIIGIDGFGFFGPVISRAPKGQEAGKLWDGVLACAQYPGFFELKRSRTVGPIFD